MMSHKEAQALEEALKRVQNIENAAGLPHYDIASPQEYKVSIRVDNSVAHGLFKPDPKLEGGWICSEQTFRAMKKNIFALDEQMLDLADDYECDGCKTLLDRQFWNFCPHCGESFKRAL